MAFRYAGNKIAKKSIAFYLGGQCSFWFLLLIAYHEIGGFVGMSFKHSDKFTSNIGYLLQNLFKRRVLLL